MSRPISKAIERFDAINARDPNKIMVGGFERPKELVLAERLSVWVKKASGGTPSDALILAARCQHIKRYAYPRSDYPEGRTAYLQWRKDLSKKHAALATQILKELKFDAALINEVRAINLKQGLKTNPDAQVMEDALCLSFLEHDFMDFTRKYDDAKVIDIVQKTWRKMSEHAHGLALQLPLSGRPEELVKKALS